MVLSTRLTRYYCPPLLALPLARGLLVLLALLSALLGVRGASAAERRTRFDPQVDGFNFVNTFNNDFVGALDIRTGGLCGGMVYSTLDYYHDRARALPRQDYRPANRTPLQSYIYNRQVDSLVPNATKWAELGMNPNGSRDAEFFRWGMTSELANLRAMIDRGDPAPLGVQGVDGGNKHQILAIGYKTGARPEDLEIYVYDPNYRNAAVTMKPDPAGRFFYYAGRFESEDDARGHQWRVRTSLTRATRRVARRSSARRDTLTKARSMSSWCTRRPATTTSAAATTTST